MAAASGQASRNVQTVASAAEELSASISEISRQVNQSSDVAGSAAAQMKVSSGQFAKQSDDLKLAVEKFLTAVRAA